MDKKELLKEFGFAAMAWGLFVIAFLFASVAKEFTYAMF